MGGKSKRVQCHKYKVNKERKKRTLQRILQYSLWILNDITLLDISATQRLERWINRDSNSCLLLSHCIEQHVITLLWLEGFNVLSHLAAIMVIFLTFVV